MKTLKKILKILLLLMTIIILAVFVNFMIHKRKSTKISIFNR